MNPSSLAGTLAGFSAAPGLASKDVIDLVRTTVTGLKYVGTAAVGTLTAMNGSTVVATLKFVGDYTHATF